MSPRVEIKDFEKEYTEKGSYHHDAIGFKKWFLKVNYELLAEPIKSHEKVLDLGCGEGEFSKYIPSDNIIGIDNSSTAIKLATKLAKKGKYIIMDMANLQFKDNSFDVVTCSLTLFYFGKDEINTVLVEVKRVLKPNGKFIFSYKNLSHPKIKDYIASLDMTKESSSLDEIEVILRKNNFEIDNCIGTNIVLDFSEVPGDKLENVYELSRKLAYYLPKESYHVVFYTRINKD